MPVYRLPEELVFPPPHKAIKEGLLAVGGDLSMERLLLAYSLGIFPWYSEEDPILWWSPDPRLVLYPEEFHLSRSLNRLMRKCRFVVTADEAFDSVIRGCAGYRGAGHQGTWIVPEVVEAYGRLHAAGFAHSVEAWLDGRLAGGLYGVSLGGVFFGESMFAKVSNASKVAMAVAVAHFEAMGFDLIDCQVTTSHLVRMGAREIPRVEFLKQLRASLGRPTLRGRWCFEDGRIRSRKPLTTG
ncbi:MAG: leucyl/phenylalanyl-tRNA--protein transferase [Desulfobacterales bacterium]